MTEEGKIGGMRPRVRVAGAAKGPRGCFCVGRVQESDSSDEGRMMTPEQLAWIYRKKSISSMRLERPLTTQRPIEKSSIGQSLSSFLFSF